MYRLMRGTWTSCWEFNIEVWVVLSLLPGRCTCLSDFPSSKFHQHRLSRILSLAACRTSTSTSTTSHIQNTCRLERNRPNKSIHSSPHLRRKRPCVLCWKFRRAATCTTTSSTRPDQTSRRSQVAVDPGLAKVWGCCQSNVP